MAYNQHHFCPSSSSSIYQLPPPLAPPPRRPSPPLTTSYTSQDPLGPPSAMPRYHLDPTPMQPPTYPSFSSFAPSYGAPPLSNNAPPRPPKQSDSEWDTREQSRSIGTSRATWDGGYGAGREWGATVDGVEYATRSLSLDEGPIESAGQVSCPPYNLEETATPQAPWNRQLEVGDGAAMAPRSRYDTTTLDNSFLDYGYQSHSPTFQPAIQASYSSFVPPLVARAPSQSLAFAPPRPPQHQAASALPYTQQHNYSPYYEPEDWRNGAAPRATYGRSTAHLDVEEGFLLAPSPTSSTFSTYSSPPEQEYGSPFAYDGNGLWPTYPEEPSPSSSSSFGSPASTQTAPITSPYFHPYPTAPIDAGSSAPRAQSSGRAPPRRRRRRCDRVGGSGTPVDAARRNHICSHCGAAFPRPSALTSHFRTHSGERPFVCSLSGCGRGFAAFSNFKRHLLSLHREYDFKRANKHNYLHHLAAASAASDASGAAHLEQEEDEDEAEEDESAWAYEAFEIV